ncbi:MAG: ABC transporter permease [Propionibacteriaceae bacterium]|jgi:erythritol transport system permease protein|nr:ABC transporter permease [Propionibacteriaceae bacterium]
MTNTLRRRLDGRLVGTFLIDQRAFVALIIIVAVFGLMSGSYLTTTNLIIMSKHVAYNAILALGMLLVILTAGIDLSIGATMCLTGIIAGVLLQGLNLSLWDITAYPQVWAVIAISLAVGTAVGFLNGLLVTRFNVAPFIATLGTMYMARGTALIISNGATFSRLAGSPELGNTGFLLIGSSAPLGIPTVIWVMVVFAIVIWVLTARTPFGRWLYATGGNERAAGLSGVPVFRVKRWVYMVSGLFAGAVGLCMVSELTSVNGDLGTSYEMNAIAAVVIGGASLAGGRGSVKGTLVGAFVIGFLTDGLVNVKVSSFWQIFIKGLVIVLAVMLDQAQEKLKNRRAATAAAASAKSYAAPPALPPGARPGETTNPGESPHEETHNQL